MSQISGVLGRSGLGLFDLSKPPSQQGSTLPYPCPYIPRRPYGTVDTYASTSPTISLDGLPDRDSQQLPSYPETPPDIVVNIAPETAPIITADAIPIKITECT